jgi:hypothetical protein
LVERKSNEKSVEINGKLYKKETRSREIKEEKMKERQREK